MANITEQQEVAKQISDAISQPAGFGDDVDEVIGSEGSGSQRKHETSQKQCPRESWGQFGGELQKRYVFGGRSSLSSS